MRIFDTHVHIGLIHEDPIEQLLTLQESQQHGIQGIVNISNNVETFEQSYEVLKSSPIVYFAAGVSPSEVNQPDNDWEQRITRHAKLPRVVAIGETGLDYYRKFGNKNAQVELFIRQLELAHKLDLPVIIHNRDAGEDVYSILKDNFPARSGVLHCYSEDWQYAQRALALGLYISLSGSVSYRKAVHLHEVAKNIPLDYLLVESESPFIVPAKYRGKRNKPKYIVETINYIAELRGMPAEELAQVCYQNAITFFGIE